jgi:glycosyltransferase involved in cell wall biosynthesis
MRIALIADVFPPMRSSGAVQLRDLSREMVTQGHNPTVLIPDSDINEPWLIEHMDGVQVMRLKAPKTKDTGYIRRTVGEFLMPFAMLLNLRKSPLADERWDGIVWYSPTIFLGPMANSLKKKYHCRSYLIIRDIFPEWAVDMGLLGRGLPYRFFKAIERYQYSVADVIGVQTPANLAYFDTWASQSTKRVEVLQNWLASAADKGCSISIANSPIAGRTIFVYAGNMGIAQGMDILIDVAAQLQKRKDIGFIFVGRGSESERLREDVKSRDLDNVVFYNEIEPDEIAGLYAQCHVGIVALDSRHKTHNIPGKFLSYMQSGLPVLASINSGNDLEPMINTESVGKVCTDYSVGTLVKLIDELSILLRNDSNISLRCKALSAKLFTPEAAVRKITSALKQI